MQTTNTKDRIRNPRKGIQFKQLPIIIEEDPVVGGFVVNCPVLKGCYTQGDTIDEALKNIKEVIDLCLDELDVEERKDLFLPRDMTFCMMKI